MAKKISAVLLIVLSISLTAGCGLIGYDVQERGTSPVVITAPPDTQEPQATPEPEQTPAVTPTPSPTPTPQPTDLPTIIGQHLDSIPALILTERVTAGTAAPDQTFAVALEEDVSTGYLWQWQGEDPGVANVLDTHWQPMSVDSGVGGPGIHIWAFQIGEPGAYTLDFTLIAPDGGVGDVQSVTVTVE